MIFNLPMVFHGSALVFHMKVGRREGIVMMDNRIGGCPRVNLLMAYFKTIEIILNLPKVFNWPPPQCPSTDSLHVTTKRRRRDCRDGQ